MGISEAPEDLLGLLWPEKSVAWALATLLGVFGVPLKGIYRDPRMSFKGYYRD